MISAAPARSLRVFRMRDRSLSCAVSPVAAISGIMDTPVSNPDRPRTRSGNAMTAASVAPPRPPTSGHGGHPRGQRPIGGEHLDQAPDYDDGVEEEERGHERDRDGDGLAEPRRNTPPSRSRKNTVMATACPCIASGMRGTRAGARTRPRRTR